MKLSITADVTIEDGGNITWFDARAYDDDALLLGSARVALVHVGEMADAQADLAGVLLEAGLGSVAETYFTQGWYKDEFADGAGIDLLHVAHVDVEPHARNLDLAIVQRLATTIGAGCQLVTMAYGDAHGAAKWSRLGFEPSTPGRTAGLLHLQLGRHHPRVVPAGDSGFDVLGGTPAVALRRTAN